MSDGGTALDELEQGLRGLLFGTPPATLPGVSEEIQQLYRRLVRKTMHSVVKNAVPLTAALLGDEGFEQLLSRWLAEAPPTTRILRKVPEGFAAFCQSLEDPPHAALGELAHWEVLQLEVAHAPDDEGPPMPSSVSEGSRVVSHPSARLAAYVHPVWVVAKGASEWPRPARAPTFLVVFRTGERTVWVTVPKPVAQVLLYTGEGLPLGAAFNAIAAEAGDVVDRAFVRSWLVNLHRRGALLGFPTGASPKDAS